MESSASSSRAASRDGSIDSPLPHGLSTQAPLATSKLSGRTLVLCFDGTSKRWADDCCNSNVIRLFEGLDKLTNEQICYYQPGIGKSCVANRDHALTSRRHIRIDPEDTRLFRKEYSALSGPSVCNVRIGVPTMLSLLIPLSFQLLGRSRKASLFAMRSKSYRTPRSKTAIPSSWRTTCKVIASVSSATAAAPILVRDPPPCSTYWLISARQHVAWLECCNPWVESPLRSGS